MTYEEHAKHIRSLDAKEYRRYLRSINFAEWTPDEQDAFDRAVQDAKLAALDAAAEAGNAPGQPGTGWTKGPSNPCRERDTRMAANTDRHLTPWIIEKATANFASRHPADDEYTHMSKAAEAAIDEAHSAFSQAEFFEWLTQQHGMDTAVEYIVVEMQRSA